MNMSDAKPALAAMGACIDALDFCERFATFENAWNAPTDGIYDDLQRTSWMRWLLLRIHPAMSVAADADGTCTCGHRTCLRESHPLYWMIDTQMVRRAIPTSEVASLLEQSWADYQKDQAATKLDSTI